MKTKAQLQEILEETENLKKLIKPGQTVWTKVTHVARSGMLRSIEAYIVDGAEIRNISWAVAKVIGRSMDSKNGGVKMGGCGMDMGFELVYSLGHGLFGQAFYCTGKVKCPSKDHRRDEQDKKDLKGSYSKLRKHTDAGYALVQRWI